MANSNEQKLLSFLKENYEQTKSNLLRKVETYNYWASGKYIEDLEASQTMTLDQIEYFQKNLMNEIQPLRFRMNWLEGQINEIQKLIQI